MPGHDVTVYERSPAELEERGAGIGFLPATYRYLVERRACLDDDRSGDRPHPLPGRRRHVAHDDAAPLPVQLVEHGVPPAAGLLRPVRLPPGPRAGAASTWNRCALRFSNGIEAATRPCGVRRRHRPRRRAPRCCPTFIRSTPDMSPGVVWSPRPELSDSHPRGPRRCHHLLRLRQQPHPRVPDPRSRRVGRPRANA